MREWQAFVLAMAVAVGTCMTDVRAQQGPEGINKKLDAVMKRMDQQDEKIEKQDEKIEKQDETIEKQDETIKKQDVTIKKQQEVIESFQQGGGKTAGGAETLNPKQEKQVEQLVNQYLSSEENRIGLGLEQVVAGYKDGFFLASRDQAYKLKFTGYVQADYRGVETNDPTASTFVLRRVRPTIEGTLAKYYNFKVQPDFGGGKAQLKDCYIDLAYFGDLSTTRLGKFKGPQGLEQYTSASNVLFVERSLMTNIAPDRDVGVMMFGKPIGDILTYQLALLNGDDRTNWQGKGADSDVDNNKAFDFAGRLQLNPFATTDNWWIKGMQLGGWFMEGREEDVPSNNTGGILSYKTGSGTTFLSTANNVRQQGRRTRAGWDAAWFLGPVLFTAEWQVMNSELQRNNGTPNYATANIPTTAWAVQASWVLTGEDATLSGLGVKPKNPFDPKSGKWGAFELAARFSQLHTDREIWEGWAARAGQTNRADDFTLGLNWYLCNNVKLMFDWDHVVFTDPISVSATSGSGAKNNNLFDEDAFWFRTQVKW